MKLRILFFLLLNFGALAIGGLFTSAGVTSDWYAGLHKAPSTPSGWVFGAAWTTIMICFAVFMAFITPPSEDRKKVIVLYSLQWVLNVAWNPLFFYLHWTTVALLVIVALWVVVGIFLSRYRNRMGWKTVLVLPYFVWLLIATSLNA